MVARYAEKTSVLQEALQKIRKTECLARRFTHEHNQGVANRICLKEGTDVTYEIMWCHRCGAIKLNDVSHWMLPMYK